MAESATGLTEAQAQARLEAGQENTTNLKPLRTLQQARRESIFTVFNLNMVGLAVILLLLSEWIGAGVTLLLLGFSTTIRNVHESLAAKRLDAVRQAGRTRSTVIGCQDRPDATQLAVRPHTSWPPPRCYGETVEEYLWVLKRSELDLIREIEPERMSELSEDELLVLHKRVRKARNKHVGNYRRKGAKRVSEVGGRGAARPGNKKSLLRAEAFEEALARVSDRLAEVAHEEAESLKAERLAHAQ